MSLAYFLCNTMHCMSKARHVVYLWKKCVLKAIEALRHVRRLICHDKPDVVEFDSELSDTFDEGLRYVRAVCLLKEVLKRVVNI